LQVVQAPKTWVIALLSLFVVIDLVDLVLVVLVHACLEFFWGLGNYGVSYAQFDRATPRKQTNA
jgi:hypothetical protein